MQFYSYLFSAVQIKFCSLCVASSLTHGTLQGQVDLNELKFLKIHFVLINYAFMYMTIPVTPCIYIDQ